MTLVALKIATELKELGTKLLKAGDVALSKAKYIKALRYLDVHPTLDDRDLILEKSFVDLKISLLLNSSLCALKSGTAEDARLVIKQMSRALMLEGEPIKAPGTRVFSDGEKGKIYYRRAMGWVIVKELEKALSDLEVAVKLVPGDGAIVAQLAATKKAIETEKAKKRAAYGKMFA